MNNIDNLTHLLYLYQKNPQFETGYLSQKKELIRIDVLESIKNNQIIIDQENIIFYAKNEQNQMIDMIGPFVKENEINKALMLVHQVIQKEGLYQYNFFVNYDSLYYKELMALVKAEFIGHEYVFILEQKDFHCFSNHLNVGLIDEHEKPTIQSMHQEIFPNVYLTSDELIKESNHQDLYVLRDENVIIGYALIKYLKDKASLEVFAIDQRYRNRGLSKPFLSQVIDDVYKNHQINQIQLVVEEVNDVARHLYQQLGFLQQKTYGYYQIKK